jgi:hypothetical protein
MAIFRFLMFLVLHNLIIACEIKSVVIYKIIFTARANIKEFDFIKCLRGKNCQFNKRNISLHPLSSTVALVKAFFNYRSLGEGGFNFKMRMKAIIWRTDNTFAKPACRQAGFRCSKFRLRYGFGEQRARPSFAQD